MTRQVLLTGAYGNIGVGTLDKLLEAGYQVSCLELDTEANREVAQAYEGRVSNFWGDINDWELLAQALQGVDTVIHLAGIIPPLTEKDPELAQRVNVDGTKAVIGAMQSSDGARRLIFASTFGVFGRVQDREPPLRNDAAYSPDDNYGRSKVAAEQAISDSGLDWTILRICAAPPVVSKATHDIRTMFEMSADARIEFVHPEDVSTAFCHAVACDEAIGKRFFLGGGKNCQLSGIDFASKIVSGSGISGGLPAEAFKPSEFPEFYGDWVDTEEAQRLLNFQDHTMDDFVNDVRNSLGLKYWMVRLLSPLAKKAVLKASPYL